MLSIAKHIIRAIDCVLFMAEHVLHNGSNLTLLIRNLLNQFIHAENVEDDGGAIYEFSVERCACLRMENRTRPCVAEPQPASNHPAKRRGGGAM